MSRQRVVVIGSGMAGARLAGEISERDPAGRVHVTVLGTERHPPYNRVLLTNVLAGQAAPADIVMTDPGWYAERGYALRPGVTVTAVDRDARRVLADDGSATGYDALVLATGADPALPPMDGLWTPGGGLRPGVFVFRTLDDCAALTGAARRARHAVVIGGGVLGLETARGLAGRGMAVTILHAAPRLMERQLDASAARILQRTYAELGIEARVNAFAVAVTGGERADGLLLDDGDRVPADLVVVSCGIRPRTALAAGCGLEVDRGVVVGDDLRTSDPRIHAIGDCAQHKGTVGGLLEPAWEQARVLATRLAGPDPQAVYTGSPALTRLKAAGVDLVAMGETLADPEDAEVVLFSDAHRSTYKKLVIRDERLVGAVLLGDDETNGTVTQIFDRGERVPADPKVLLFGGLAASAPAGGPAALADEATVCRCNGVTMGDIGRAYLGGAADADAVAAVTRCGTGCGTCRGDVDRIVAGLAAG
ncbi:FAD-dependent oxidoreductase [Actinomadura scrupuli]|uniref:FAD-dependent oxidoreductase n=1 Tax=Actinomadura scrupuli TaxID=559629 RepID=UPI003D99A6FA